MRTIQNIEVFPIRLPITNTFRFASGSAGKAGDTAPFVLVKLTDNEREVGWGEGRPMPQWSYETAESITTTIRHYLAPAILGQEITDRWGLHRRMHSAIGRGPSTGFPIAKAAVDMAVHDVCARSAGQPLRTYLGGSSERNTVVLSYTLTAHEAEAVQREVLDAMEKGFRHFNFKAAVTPETDIALAKVIRRTAGPHAFVWADANQGFEPHDFFTDVPWLPPSHPTMTNYGNVLQANFGTYFANTAFVTVISVLLIVVVSLLAAYAISRMSNRFTLTIFSLFLVGLAIPLQATIIPIYAMITEMHLYDTLFALILPSVAFGIPLSVLILVTYIRDIPKELHESMYLDGAGHLRILRSLVLPLTRPALIMVIIYESLLIWNGFLFPLVLTQSSSVRTLPLALWTFQGQFTTNVPAILAAVFLTATPIILLYIFGRRQLLAGLTAGFSK